MRYKILPLLLCIAMVLSWIPGTTAAGANTPEQTAPDSSAQQPQQEAVLLSTKRSITAHEGFSDISIIYDDVLTKSISTKQTASVTLENDQGIGSMYFIYQLPYTSGYTVTDNATGESFIAGKNGFLHEYLDLVAAFGQAPTSVTVSYTQGKAHICELMLYSAGQVPETVQIWKPPAENKTDLLLFSTHGDDEQLFFAGILPYYAKAKGYNVQVVYLTDHRNITNVRTHEMLNGLWAVGCDVYPVFGTFPDFLEDTLKQTYAEFKTYGVTRDDILEFSTEAIRRFKPKVVIAHDFDGEYAHGQHMVYADCVAEALEISSDPEKWPGSAEEYGTWDVPKAYFHLYDENPIVMDWDTPMEELDGMSPFLVTQKLGFPCHESQQWTWFFNWINGKPNARISRADEIATYSPCEFGLYRSTVGQDVAKNDFFENVTTYAQDHELWLQQNPPETTPPETTPAETTPTPTTSPEATANPQPSQPQSPVGPQNNGNDGTLLIIWLVILAVLVVMFVILLILRFKK